MYFSNDEIKAMLLDEWEQLEGSAYPEDMLDEFADGVLPVYYSDILKDWAEMPNEFTDNWQEFGLPSSKTEEITIFGLMTNDLYIYYRAQFWQLYKEVLAEKAEVANV